MGVVWRFERGPMLIAMGKLLFYSGIKANEV